MNDLLEQFEAFDEAHADVWRLFEKLTFQLIRAGREHSSADLVLHRIRWDYATSTSGDAPKINNNYSAAYARKFAAAHPEHKEFFARRVSRLDAYTVAAPPKQVEMFA